MERGIRFLTDSSCRDIGKGRVTTYGHWISFFGDSLGQEQDNNQEQLDVINNIFRCSNPQ